MDNLDAALDAALANWLRLYGLLTELRERLANLPARQQNGIEAQQLDVEITRVLQAHDEALSAMQSRFDLVKKAQGQRSAGALGARHRQPGAPSP
jgi:hypothetical protein